MVGGVMGSLAIAGVTGAVGGALISGGEPREKKARVALIAMVAAMAFTALAMAHGLPVACIIAGLTTGLVLSEIDPAVRGTPRAVGRVILATWVGASIPLVCSLITSVGFLLTQYQDEGRSFYPYRCPGD